MTFNWDVYTKLSTLQTQIHWMAAVVALAVGITIFLRKKGTSSHRMLGRLFVVAMIATSVSAFFVRGIGNSLPITWLSEFSFIHLLIPYTLYTLYDSIKAIRRGDVRRHKNGMIAVFIGGLLIAGAFTFLPGRHMHTFFFGDAAEVQQSVESGSQH